MMEQGIKFVVLSFASFMHYIATMLAFFVPIDIAHKVFNIPQMPAILIGSFVLWFWAMATAFVVLKTLDGIKDMKNDNR